eukprot:scaffold6972_cov72-Skeletonema_dohrnii-CCMP3373.AAC.1
MTQKFFTVTSGLFDGAISFGIAVDVHEIDCVYLSTHHFTDFDLSYPKCQPRNCTYIRPDTNIMKIIPALFVAGFSCRGGVIDAFSFASHRSRDSGRLYDLTTVDRFGDAQSMHQQPRTKCILCMKGDQSSPTDETMSRRAAL